MAAEAGEAISLLLCFDALGQHRHTQCGAKRDNGFRNGSPTTTVQNILQERAVDLQLVQSSFEQTERSPLKDRQCCLTQWWLLRLEAGVVYQRVVHWPHIFVEMCALSELCELNPQDAVESPSVKGVMGGVGLLFEETRGLGRRISSGCSLFNYL
jgi:hypothetical protein